MGTNNNRPSSFESLSTSDLDSCYPHFPKYPSYLRSNSMMGPISNPRSPRFLSCDDGAHHFLDSCHLCNKPLAGGRDIFMYRGDTPFCSEECRQEQIEMDEAGDKRIKRALKQQQQSKSSSKTEKIHVRVTGTVVAG